MKNILYILTVLMLFGCEETMPGNNFIPKKKSKKVVQSVIEKKIVVKNVYVNEDDFSSYSSDETGSSYWYVYFQSEAIRGYDIIELDVPYPDIAKLLKIIRVSSRIKDDEFTSINFMHRVTFEGYKSYHEKNK